MHFKPIIPKHDQLEEMTFSGSGIQSPCTGSRQSFILAILVQVEVGIDNIAQLSDMAFCDSIIDSRSADCVCASSSLLILGPEDEAIASVSACSLA